MKKLVAVFTIFLTACAGANYRPLIDTAGVDMNRMEGDLAQCQQYAGQVSGAATQAAVGAAIGAGLSALLAGVGGGRNRFDMGATARIGAVGGAASGAASGETDQRNIVRRCMAQRGYRVLQ